MTPKSSFRRALPRYRLPRYRLCHRIPSFQQSNQYATVVARIPAAPLDTTLHSSPPIERHPPTQPPSYKPPELRKSQLHRQYTSLLRSTPLMLLFQHNNLKANEWVAIRRELSVALRKASASASSITSSPPLPPDEIDAAAATRLHIIQTGIFAAALRVTEFYHPSPPSPDHSHSYPPTNSLSPTAYAATLPPPRSSKKPRRTTTSHKKLTHPLHTLLSGPLALLTFPTVTPALLSTALSILSPTPGATSAFPAPRRRDVPGYYEPAVQSGLQKLLLLGARVEGRVLGGDGVRWVGGLKGGVEGLRGELIGLLVGMGGRVTGVLEGVGRSLYGAVEGRRVDMEKSAVGEGGREDVV